MLYMNNLIDELMKQIAGAEEQAIQQGIRTNAIIINKDYDFCPWLNIGSRLIKPMILGKYILKAKLPSEYGFALTHVDEEKLESELDYYKKRCEELEAKLNAIKEELL